MVYFCAGLGNRCGERPLFPRFVVSGATPTYKDGLNRSDCLAVDTEDHEVLGIKRENRLKRLSARIDKSVLKSRHWQARVIRVAWLEWTPPAQLDLNRKLSLAQRHRSERK